MVAKLSIYFDHLQEKLLVIVHLILLSDKFDTGFYIKGYIIINLQISFNYQCVAMMMLLSKPFIVVTIYVIPLSD